MWLLHLTCTEVAPLFASDFNVTDVLATGACGKCISGQRRGSRNGELNTLWLQGGVETFRHESCECDSIAYHATQ